MSDDRFVFVVRRTTADFYATLRLLSPEVWGWWRSLWNCGLLPLAGYAIAVFIGARMLDEIIDFDAYGSAEVISVLTFTAVISGACAILFPLISNAILKPNFVAPNGDFLQPREIVVDAEGVNDKRDHLFRQVRWPAIKGVKKGPKGYFFLIDLAEGIYIPLSAFSPMHDREAFEDFVDRMISSSRN